MTVSLEESFAYCKELAKRTGKNFYFSFLTLPPEPLRDMCVLYAFMRQCDDLGDDESKPVCRRTEELAAWRDSLEAALSGARFDHPVFPALQNVVDRYGIPTEYLFAVVDGVRMDLTPQPFETFADLEHYCYHVAGAVGLCCIYIWGFHDDHAIHSAVDCGTAFQLTNILRDLAEDAQMGRFYLPHEDLRRFDCKPEDIIGPCRDERFRQLMQFQTDRAKSYYRRAEELFDYLEPRGKPILAAMLRIYGGLLSEIEKRDFDVFSHRVRLPKWRKLMIIGDILVRERLWNHHRP
jgi:15-cis-phytoene synthase